MNVSEFAPIIAIFIPVVAIIGGIGVGIAAILSNARVREARIRERIAMIEKGLVPPPEVDPAGFDRAMHRHERSGYGGPKRAQRRAGVIVMGVGFGLMFLISVAGGGVSEGVVERAVGVEAGEVLVVSAVAEEEDVAVGGEGEVAAVDAPDHAVAAE